MAARAFGISDEQVHIAETATDRVRTQASICISAWSCLFCKYGQAGPPGQKNESTHTLFFCSNTQSTTDTSLPPAPQTPNPTAPQVANSNPTAASMSTDLYGMATLDACQQINDRLKPVRARLGPGATFQQIALVRGVGSIAYKNGRHIYACQAT